MSNSHENVKNRVLRFLHDVEEMLDKQEKEIAKLKNERSQSGSRVRKDYRCESKSRDGIGVKRGAEIDPKAILEIQKEIYEERLRCEREAERKYWAKLRKKEEKRKAVIRWLEESENHVEPRDMKVKKKEGDLEHELEVIEETPNFVIGVESAKLGEQTPKFDEGLEVGVEDQDLGCELVYPYLDSDVVVCEHGDKNVEIEGVVGFENKVIEQEVAKEKRGEEKSLVVQEVELVVVYHEYKDPYLVPHEANTSLPILFKSFLQVSYVGELQPHYIWQRQFKLHLFYVCQSEDPNLLNSWHGSRNFPFDLGGAVAFMNNAMIRDESS